MIELVHIHKEYDATGRGSSGTTAVDDVSLTLENGQFTVVVGRSGCGKTTLLNLIAGFELPTSGEVLLDGKRVHGPGSERLVVFQQPVLYPWLDVRHNVSIGLRMSQGRRKVDWKRVAELIEIMGLDGFENHYPHQLSGGMQQRAAIARSLILNPSVLLMDEPFGALDAQTRTAMQDFLLNLWNDLRATVLFVTHDVEEAILLGDRVVVMTPRPGKIASVVDVRLARPRSIDVSLTDEFLEIKREVLASLHTVPRQEVRS